MQRSAKRLGPILLAAIAIGSAAVAAPGQTKSGVPSVETHPIKPHLIATQAPFAPSQSLINSELAPETPIGPGILYVQTYPTDQQQNAPVHGHLGHPVIRQRPEIPTAGRPHLGKRFVQPNRVLSGSPNLTGINRWWTYDQGVIPGVGSYLANVTTGNLIIQAGDMATPHKGIALTFSRTYNSFSQHDYANSDGSVPSNYGNGWTNTFDAHIAYNDLNLNQGISVFDTDGARYDYSYVCSPTCKYVPPAGQFATLTQTGVGIAATFAWTKKSGTIFWFNNPNASVPGVAGRLTEIVGRNSNTFLKFAYYFDAGYTDSAHLNEVRVVPEWAGSPGTAISYVDLKFIDVVCGTGCNLRLLHKLFWIDGTTYVVYDYGADGHLAVVTEPSNSSNSSTPSIPQDYQVVSGTHLIQTVNGGRWSLASPPATDGGWDKFNYSGNAVTSIQSFGLINPTVTDESGTGPIQTSISGNYGNGTTPYRTVSFANSTVSPPPSPLPSPPAPAPTGAAVCTTSSSTASYDSDGHESLHCFDPTGRVVQTDLWTGVLWLKTTQSWDSSNDLTSMTDPRGKENDAAYDGNGNPIAFAQPAESSAPRPTTLITYDAHNNVIAECDPVWSHANSLDWQATPAPTYSPCPANAANSATNPGPTLYTYTYPSSELFGELSAVTKPMGYSTTISYETGPQGGSIDYGQPTKIAGAPILQNDFTSITHQTQYYYDQYGNTICSADRGGIDSPTPTYNTSINVFSGANALLGRVTQHGDPDDASLSNGACSKTPGIPGSTITTTYTYFTNGQIQTTQSPVERAAGVSTQYSYDADGDPTSTVTHFGSGGSPATTTRFYDADDKLVEVIKPGGWLTRYDYDLSQNATNNNAVTLVGVTSAFKAHGALFKIQEYHFNAPIVWVDMKGAAYDSLGRSVNAYAYTPNVNCTLNNLTTCETASVAARVYDGVAGPGMLDTSTDPVGVVTTYRYNNGGRVNSIGFSGGTSGTAPLYDLDGRVASVRETCGTCQSNYLESFAYDRDGNQIQKTEQPENNSAPVVLAYQYYPDGSRASTSLSGAINQTNLFTYDYDASGRPKNSILTFNSTTKNFAFAQTRAGRPVSETDPYSTTTTSYDTAAGRLQSMIAPQGTTSFASYDPEGEVLAFTEPNSTTAVSQNFDALGEIVQQTPPGSDQNGCALGFTQTPYQGYTVADATVWDGTQCMPGSPITGVEDIRNAVQVSEYAKDSFGHRGLHSVTFDADGRMTLGWNGNAGAQYTRSYDAESRLIDQHDGSGNLQMKRIYGPDGHIAQIGTTDTNQVLHLETLHWDGNAILFTTNQSGQVDDIKIGSTADYFVQDPTPHAQLTVWDRDYTGHMRGCHNGGGHSVWSPLDPYIGNGNPLPSIFGCAAPAMYGLPIGQGGAILQPDGDGYWDGFVMIQGARDFDLTLRGWIEPDSVSGTAWNPMTQKSYTWNNNNPSVFSDPSGMMGNDEHLYGPEQPEWNTTGDLAQGVGDANGVPYAFSNGNLFGGPLPNVNAGINSLSGWSRYWVDVNTFDNNKTTVTAYPKWKFDSGILTAIGEAWLAIHGSSPGPSRTSVYGQGYVCVVAAGATAGGAALAVALLITTENPQSLQQAAVTGFEMPKVGAAGLSAVGGVAAGGYYLMNNCYVPLFTTP